MHPAQTSGGRIPRLLRRAFATLCFLVGVLTSVPSVTSERDPSVIEPAPEQVESILELSAWLFPAGGRFDLGHRDLTTAIREKPRGFELFRRFAGGEQKRTLLDGLPYGRAIERSAEEWRVDPLLVAAVVAAESSFDAGAVSPAGALGLMQVMPATAALYGVEDPREPAANLEVGTRYLRDLLESFGGDLELALAAYNAGPANVARHGGVPPYPETRRYVGRVLSKYVEHHRALWWESEDAGWLLRSAGRTAPPPAGPVPAGDGKRG